MRRSEKAPVEMEFPTRYALDEARFSGGREHIRNEEDKHESSTHLA